MGKFMNLAQRNTNQNIETCGILAGTIVSSGPGSSVGIVTGCGLEGPGIESRWGKIFHTSPDWPWGPPSHLYNRYRVFTGCRMRPGCDADPLPPSKQSRAIPLLSLRDFVACKNGETYLQLYHANSTGKVHVCSICW
jgi:hypothetical protein